MRTPVPAPVNATYATWADFWRLIQLSGAGVYRALVRAWPAQAMFALMWTAIGALAGLECAFSASLEPLIFVPTSWATLLAGITFLVLVVNVSWRLRSGRLIILSADKTAVLDVIVRREYFTIANHTKLSGTTSVAELRQSIDPWRFSLTSLPLRFWAQNERVARLYLAQFPSLERTGKRRLVELET